MSVACRPLYKYGRNCTLKQRSMNCMYMKEIVKKKKKIKEIYTQEKEIIINVFLNIFNFLSKTYSHTQLTLYMKIAEDNKNNNNI